MTNGRTGMATLTAMGATLTLALLAGCASNGATEEKASASAAADKEARCMVTGSNLPKRDCRNDVVVLPPAAAETVMPVLPSSVPRN